MTVNIIYVGNTKEKYFLEATVEYEKRLSQYCKINSVELKEEKLPENPSEAQIVTALSKEGDRIKSAIPQKSYKIALCIEGYQLSSIEFADKIEIVKNDGFSQITFIIGSSFGLDESLKKQCDLRLSVSKMTFPHRFMRVILLEQIYRAFNILSGGKYHK